MRFRLVTLGVAVLMLVGTVYLFRTMPTGFIPSQDSGFIFGVVLGPQDISFESMARHHRAIAEIVRRDPGVKDVGAFVIGGNQAMLFCRPEAARPARALRGPDHRELRPKVMAVPGVFTFLQNPPPITVSGQFGASAYQMTLQSTNLQEIYAWAPRLAAKMQQIPGFVDVNSDMQICQPAGDGGYRPRPRAGAGSQRRNRCRTRCTAPSARARSR